jgi:carboxypeptidase family protein
MTSKSNLAVWTRVGLVACLAVLVSIASLSFGQQLTGTLSGTTMDSTGAVVANAKVTMKNEASGDTRTTVSNGSGYFTITAVQPGTYTVTISAAGFKNWSQSGIVFAQGDTRTLSQIALQVGAVNETVEIHCRFPLITPKSAQP